MNIRIKDIAREAGVSERTVGRVLRGQGPLKKDTRVKIEKLLREKNYKPNIIARSLRTKRSYNIGFVVHDMESLQFPHLAMILLGIEDEAAQKGFNIQISFTDVNYEKASSRAYFTKLIDEQRVDGLIINKEDMLTDDIIRTLPKLPTVLVNSTLIRDGRPSTAVTVEQAGTVKAAEYLKKSGVSNPCFITRDFISAGAKKNKRNPSSSDMLKYRAYKSVFSTVPYFEGSGTDHEKITSALKQALKLDSDALVFADDRMAIQAMSLLIDSYGKKVPEDIAVIGFYDIQMAKFYRPPLSTIAIDMEEMGRIAARVVIDKVTGKAAGGQYTVPSRFILRKSC